MQNAQNICYLNGQFLPLDDARVPVLDRGFIFGDGVYEVIPVFNGISFRLDEHLERLGNSLTAVHIENPYNHDEWRDLITRLIKENGAHHQSIYLQLTRGVAARDHAFPHEVTPTVFMMSTPLPISTQAQPVSAVVLNDPRWINCDIKAISLLPNVLLRQEARLRGAYEAILLRDDFLTEGAASNVFIVKEGIVKTPPKSSHLLPGITRDLVVELLRKNDRAVEEVAIHKEELLSADEIWLTSSTKEILPVDRLDEKAVGNGKPGPVWQDTVALYQDFKESFHASDDPDAENSVGSLAS